MSAPDRRLRLVPVVDCQRGGASSRRRPQEAARSRKPPELELVAGDSGHAPLAPALGSRVGTMFGRAMVVVAAFVALVAFTSAFAVLLSKLAREALAFNGERRSTGRWYFRAERQSAPPAPVRGLVPSGTALDAGREWAGGGRGRNGSP